MNKCNKTNKTGRPAIRSSAEGLHVRNNDTDTRKAFATSLITINIILVLLLLWFIVQNAGVQFEKNISEPLPLLYSGYLFNDAFGDVNSIVGPNFWLNQSNATIIIEINDSFPRQNYTLMLKNYSDFLQFNLSKTLNANITTNFTNITDGSLELYFFGKYKYINNHSGASEIVFSAFTNPANVTRYMINITVPQARNANTSLPFNSSGTLNITLNYYDNNGSIIQSGMLFTGNISTFNVTYGNNGSIQFIIGRRGDVNSTFSLLDSNASSVLNMFVTTQVTGWNGSSAIYYNTWMNYTQAKVSKYAMLGR